MTPFTVHSGRAAWLPADNVDTDQILPARFLKKPRSAGYGNFLFHDLRRDADGAQRTDFPLNVDGTPPSILVAGDNFGCGSSREGAVYALIDGGIRAVVSTRIADIFRNNAVRNGLCPVLVEPETLKAIAAAVDAHPDRPVTIDLSERLVTCGEATFPFEIDESSRRRLLLGLDEIGETAERMDLIEAAEADRQRRRPWVRPQPASG